MIMRVSINFHCDKFYINFHCDKFYWNFEEQNKTQLIPRKYLKLFKTYESIIIP